MANSAWHECDTYLGQTGISTYDVSTTPSIPNIFTTQQLFSLIPDGPISRAAQRGINVISDPNVPITFDATGQSGLGEGFMQLRYALAAARKLHERPTRIILDYRLMSLIPILDSPENVVFIDNRFVNPAGNRIGTPRGNLEEIYPIEMLSTPRNNHSISEGKINMKDLNMVYWFRLLGLDVTYDDILETPFSLQPGNKLDQQYSLVIAPGAICYPTQDGSRSLKSLDPAVWGKAFEALVSQGFSGNVAVLTDIDHREYSSQVAKMCQRAGLDVAHVSCPTLPEVVELVCKGERFVGGDGSISHIAAQVIAAARKLGVNISFRQFFNTLVAEERYWRIVVPGIDGKAMSYNGILSPDSSYPLDDISNIPPELIARFMLS